MTSDAGGDHRPDAARKTHWAQLLGILLVIAYLSQTGFGSDLADFLTKGETPSRWNPWVERPTINPFLRVVVIAVPVLLLWAVTKILRDVVVRHRRKKNDHGPESPPTKPA